jgi:hypothetical protein
MARPKSGALWLNYDLTDISNTTSPSWLFYKYFDWSNEEEYGSCERAGQVVPPATRIECSM